MSDPLTDASLALDPKPEPGARELIDRAQALAVELAGAAGELAGLVGALTARLAKANRANADLARRLAELEARAGTPDLYRAPQAKMEGGAE
jgi:hypothetical protein